MAQEQAQPAVDPQLALIRERILHEPDVILGDRKVMEALVRGETPEHDRRNVVDLRGRLVAKLEERLDQLEDTHRSVIAAAYENLAGTNQIHRAVTTLLAPEDFTGFLKALADEVSDILAIDVIRIGLETTGAEPGQPLGPRGPLEELIIALPRGGARSIITGRNSFTPRKVALRRTDAPEEMLYGPDTGRVLSEAVMQLDLGEGFQPGVLAFGSEDEARFSPAQGTDLLAFLTSIVEVTLRRWLT